LGGFESLISIEFKIDELKRLRRSVGSAPTIFGSGSDARARRVRTGEARPHVGFHGMTPGRGEDSTPDRGFSVVSERGVRIAAGMFVILRLQADRLGVARPSTRGGVKPLEGDATGLNIAWFRRFRLRRRRRRS